MDLLLDVKVSIDSVTARTGGMESKVLAGTAIGIAYVRARFLETSNPTHRLRKLCHNALCCFMNLAADHICN